MARPTPPPSSKDSRDPRFRTFRIAMYGLYIAIVTVFCVMLSVSVIGSVLEMSPRTPATPDALLAATECVAQAEALWRELDTERKDFTRTQPAKGVDEAFTRFRVEWLRKLRQLEGRCATDQPSRAALKDVFRKLERVQDRYTTHAVQYAGEVGPAVDDLLTSITEARAQVK